MIRNILIFFLVLFQGNAFGQCSEFSNFHYLELDSVLKKYNANLLNDNTLGIHYSKLFFDHNTGGLHVLKTINIVDSFDLQIDTTLLKDLNSNHFGTINPSDFFNEIIEVLSISTEDNFYVFTSTNGCQMIDLLPDFIHENFKGSDILDLTSVLTKNMSSQFHQDTIDFGMGYTTYDSSVMNLDTVFYYDRFKEQSIQISLIPFVEDSSGISLKGKQLAIQKNNNEKLVVEAIYSIVYKQNELLAVYAYRWSPNHSTPAYIITLINEKGEVFRVIDNGNQLSPNPNCFSDLNKDGKLEYIEIDRLNEYVKFMQLENWKELKKHRIALKYLNDGLYLMRG
jgi:hypothetical protein